MARTDYGAILSTVIKDTSDSIREVNGTSALIAPSDWGTQIRTMVSGSKYQQALDNFPVITIPQTPIASFDDGAGNVPFKEILAYIQATQSGTGDPSPINIRPISGVNSVDTTVCGKNLCFQIVSNRTIATDGSITANNSYDVGIAKVAQGVKFTLSCDSTSQLVCSFFYRIPKTGEASYNSSRTVQSGMTITAPIDGFIAFRVSKGYTYIQFEKGETDTAYHAYTGTTVTTALGGTYYGGYVNVTTGLLTIDKLIKDLGTLDYTYVASGNRFTNSGSGIADEVKLPASDSQLANIMCDKLKPMSLTALRSSSDDYLIAIGDTGRISIRWTATQDPIAFKTAITGTNLVYELATPQEIQLTPQQIEQLRGENNVFCSTGDVAVKYYSIGGEIPSGN